METIVAFALPSRAYDLQMLDRPADRARDHGWVYWLPGITSEQWPRDPVSGYPLMHGFTLLLPEDYRVHGADIVVRSFFPPRPITMTAERPMTQKSARPCWRERSRRVPKKRIDDGEPADAAAMFQVFAVERVTAGLDCRSNDQSIIERKAVIAGKRKRRSVRV